MASNVAPAVAATPDTIITIKATYDGSNRRIKMPLHDLNATVFHSKLRTILDVPENKELVLERFSDSSSQYILLDPDVPSTYKQLYRAAKAKLKLRIKATTSTPADPAPVETPAEAVADTEPVDEPKAAEAVTKPEVVPEQPQATVKESEPFLLAAAKPTPTPRFNTEARKIFLERLKARHDARELSNQVGRTLFDRPQLPSLGFQVSCDDCSTTISDAHFHCSICSGGDYDLCEGCVEAGKHCPSADHWMIKRHIKNGEIVSNNTERRVRKVPSSLTEKEQDVPEAVEIEFKPQSVETEAVRTCNVCVRVLPEKAMVSCVDCDDFDLCTPCHIAGKSGHHPGHAFTPLVDDDTVSSEIKALCAAGRNIRHDAICDGCDKNISGVRHKCLDCPDWDYCNDCVTHAETKHKDHRFVPIYEPLGLPQRASEMTHNFHFGVYCDGPLCKGKTNQYYIRGIRYKCAICNDTDFCAVCEAHPDNKHNSTHPLIKFKTRVKNVSVSTVGEDAQGTPLPAMGDKKNAETLVGATSSQSNEASQSNDSPTNPTPESKEIPTPFDSQATQAPSSSDLHALFIQDLVKDGSVYGPDVQFRQVWTLGNPGPYAWPIGCSVRRVGGDNMMDIRRSHATSLSELTAANESNQTEYMVPPGERFSFTVTMRTPARDGKHISYWRLKAPDGTAFGHKLWCDVEVKYGNIGPANGSVDTRSLYQRPFLRLPGTTPCSIPSAGVSDSVPVGTPPTKLENESRRRCLQKLQQERREQMEERVKFARGRRGAPGVYPHNRLSAPVEDDTERKFASIKDQLNTMEEANRRRMALARAQHHHHYSTMRGTPMMAPNPEVDAARPLWPPQPYTFPNRLNSFKSYSMESDNRKAASIAATAAATAASQKQFTGPPGFYAGAAKAPEVQPSFNANPGCAPPGFFAYNEPVAESSAAATKPDAPEKTVSNDEMQSSQMVYPKLEKESPASSTTHLESVAPNAGAETVATESHNDTATEVEVESETVTSAGEEQDPLFETVDAAEVETFELQEDDEASEAAFEYLTDEEYDILDASDEEFANRGATGL